MSESTVPQNGDKLPARRVAFGMMPRELMEFALPMDRPKRGEHVWTRRNGRVTYTVTAGAVPDADGVLYSELPSGRYARAALLYLFSEAWVTERATVDLGMCTHQYLAALGVPKSGSAYREAVRQLNLVAAAQFTIQVDAETTEDDERGPGRSRVIDRARVSEHVRLWEPAVRADPEAEMTPATITLSRQLIEMARRHSVPVPWEAWGHLMRTTRSPLALDVYMWLCARLYKVPCTTRITWEQLHAQFGSRSDLRNFKRAFRQAVSAVKEVWPEVCTCKGTCDPKRNACRVRESKGRGQRTGFRGYVLEPGVCAPRESVWFDTRGKD